MDQNQSPAGMPAPDKSMEQPATAPDGSAGNASGTTPAPGALDAPQPSRLGPDEAPLHVWMQRTFLVIYVVFCLEIGMLLTILPWTEFWYNNPLLLQHMALKAFLSHNFVRGMVSGVGLLDIWLGISEAVHYHDLRPDSPLAP